MSTLTSVRKVALKYWAVRIGDYVEIRVGSQAPKPITSKISKEIITERQDAVRDGVDTYGYPRYKYVTKKVPSKLTLKQTFWNGGKVLGLIRYRSFQAKTGMSIEQEGMTEITRAIRFSLLGEA